jgi:murein DD-endopeptidase MepM/ murein hydrolase activator NlpD
MNYLNPIDYLKVYCTRVNDFEYAFYADNDNYCPYQVFVNPEMDKDLTTDVKLPYYTIIDPQNKNYYLFSVFPRSARKDQVLKFKSYYSFGNPDKVSMDNNFAYLFPFEEGKEIKIVQGYNSRYTHTGWTKYSLDFGMNIGSPIYASRGGTVVAVKDNSNKGGPYYRYRNYANFILIYHDDGTFSEYMHLELSGSVVKVGDRVKAGDVIGYSGNTGMTTGPHLHFMVLKPGYLSYMTFPVKFLSSDGMLINPEYKKTYFSFHNSEGKTVTAGLGKTDSDTGVGGP